MTLVLMRHAESTWNAGSRFTGWADPGLSGRGRVQARQAGVALRAAGIDFDLCLVSGLIRTRETAALLLAGVGGAEVPVQVDWRLNERHLGALQGLTKREVVARWGNDRRKTWRDDPDALPPGLDDGLGRPGSERPGGRCSDSACRGESIRSVDQRVRACWSDVIAPAVATGRSILVVTHAGPVRALLALGGDAGRRRSRFVEHAQPIILTPEFDLDFDPGGRRPAARRGTVTP